jgi:exonuclease III
MKYWENTRGKLSDIIKWKNNCLKYLLNENDIDFFIFQEINPIKLFENNHNHYEFTMTEYNIIYHELKNELLFDGRTENFWGNAILYNKKYKLLDKNGLIDFNKYKNNYYGRNGIMCYEFSSDHSKNITIINFYNKINYANKGEYLQEYFENDNEITNILENSNKSIILTGDFNTGYKYIDKEKYDDFISKYQNKYNLKNCIHNYSKDFIPTSYWKRNGQFYINDYCFSKNFTNIKLLNKQDEWKNIGKMQLWRGLSDHRALIIELNF